MMIRMMVPMPMYMLVSSGGGLAQTALPLMVGYVPLVRTQCSAL